MPEKVRRFAVVDLETDPFNGADFIEPFAWGFYDGERYVEKFTGTESAIPSLLKFLEDEEEEWIIYAHNGGKFDWMFLIAYIEGEMRVIGSRIVQARLGKHELRDSMSIMPVPLKKLGTATGGSKLEIPMEYMKRENRFKRKRVIMEYLKQDCVTLWHAIQNFRFQLGDALTMASAAMRHLNKVMCDGTERKEVHDKLKMAEDTDLRSFYSGGRVQCFKKGIIRAPLKVYDVTSMYPAVMASEMHPVSKSYTIGTKGDLLDPGIDFAVIEGYSRGALPARAEDGSLSFPYTRRRFFATGHEIRAGIETGRLRVDKLIHTRRAARRMNFKKFIDEMMALRRAAQKSGDKFHDLLWKLVMNSTYGKFAQNPTGYKEHFICRDPNNVPSKDDGWELNFINDNAVGYHRPLYRMTKNADGEEYLRLFGSGFHNVGCAASITGAARALLLRAINRADNPIYCDTDSIICEGLSDLGDGAELGGWKLEAEGDTLAVGGKKLYALFKDGVCVKKASKGVNLPASDIVKVAEGDDVTWTSVAPQFTMEGQKPPLRRTVRMTG